MTDRQPSLAEVFTQAIEHRLAGLHVCLPGTIETYDATTQTASVRPAIKNVIHANDGEKEFDYPVIPNVPVAHPRAGKWFVHFPLTPGDSIVLVFGERSLDKWRALGGTQNPLDLRKHDLSDAIAIPGNLYPDANPLASLTVSGDHFSLGKDDGSTIHVNVDGTIALGSPVPIDAVATANKVLAELTKIQVAALAISVIPPAVDPATTVTLANGIKAAFIALLASPFPVSVASVKVKCDP